MDHPSPRSRPRPLRSFANARIHLESHEIVTRALRSSGLEDFDGMDFVEPLEILCRSLDREARLHPRGRLATRRRLVALLTMRARVAQALRDRPTLTSSPLVAPIVITGLPHSGVAQLHRLLSASDGLRVLHTGEESALLEASFASLDLDVDWHIPAFSEWYDSADLTGAYQRLASTLRAIDRDRPPRRWLLHAWQHLEQLDALLAAFPDATIVTVHRNLDDGVEAWIAEVCERRARCSDDVEPAKVDRYWRWRLESLARRGAAQRAVAAPATGAPRFVDVTDASLRADPAGTATRVLAACAQPIA